MNSPVRLIALCCLVAACATPAPRTADLTEITFRSQPPFRLAANLLDVVDAYRPPLRLPNVEHQAPVMPSAVLRRWAEERLVPVGGGGRIRATILDARIIETVLPVNQTFWDSFRTEQAARFDGRVEMSIDLLDSAGAIRASARGNAVRVRGLPEDATLGERERLLFELTESLARDLDKVLQYNIRQYFAAHMVP